jgi:hypothetical protein
MDSVEKSLFADTITNIMTTSPPEMVRTALDQFGWRELLDEAPADAVSVVLPLAGEHLATAPLLDDVCAQACGLPVSGDVAVVYPALSSAVPTSSASAAGTRVSIDLRGVLASRAGAPDVIVLPVVRDGIIAMLTAASIGAWPERGTAMGAESGWTTQAGQVEIEPLQLLEGENAARAWETMRAAGHRALAHEMIGVGSVMLRLALEHVNSREQFGRTLAGFQVVRHKLADVRLWLECASLAAETAWERADPDASALAKILAGRFLRTARENCQQVLGGMGFTWEHPFHHYLRRGLVLEPLLGSSATLRAEVGTRLRLLAIPRLADL